MNFSNKIPADYTRSINILTHHKDITINIRGMAISWEGPPQISYYSDVERDSTRYMHFVYNIISSTTQVEDRYDYRVPLLTTNCNYGGVRYWFQCPSCISRVGILYLRGPMLMCRRCSNLTYESNLLSGKHKREGRIVSAQELEDLKGRIKRRFYAGKPTKIFVRYLKKVGRFLGALSRLGIHLSQQDIEASI